MQSPSCLSHKGPLLSDVVSVRIRSLRAAAPAVIPSRLRSRHKRGSPPTSETSLRCHPAKRKHKSSTKINCPELPLPWPMSLSTRFEDWKSRGYLKGKEFP